MKYIDLAPSLLQGRRLSFFLAMEEYVAQSLDEPEAFFCWQVPPTVIIGRNQVLRNEVNVDYCQKHGISVFRRKSGGGCVYADEQNLMLSCILQHTSVNLAFSRFMGLLQLALRRMGIEAVTTVHNDLLIGGRKVSGTACTMLPGGAIVHGTLLYDTNMQHMLNAITPPAEKLQKKGIESVRQRITVLRDFIPQVTMDELKAFIRQTVCNGERMLTPADVAAIERLEQAYTDPDFINQES